ncbi:uncharacterized protein LOC18445538 isoform X3 [Amborella trichopoda]|uniref:uncharacterized protein LOC18445538 isoform X3 n=1 Tax=Amborella trichopoda TaxID=13333 RepID=UPI0009BC99DC|nr:uncharacterized protein LOC18445538 isoform X3 [Amborella trichopoda]|eukprot:XP_020530075.1 uncharacterized protein LOC18445538 isoform X3 [Amborella trichopoda]
MTPERHQASSDIAAPLIFFFILALHLLTQFLGHIKKRGSQNIELIKLRQEIKQLLKEASSLLVPSTFAKAAKLRRVAAEKEKELLRIQKSQEKDKLWAFDFYLGSLQIVKSFLANFWIPLVGCCHGKLETLQVTKLRLGSYHG